MEVALIARLLAACVVIGLVLAGVQIFATRLGRSSLGRRGGTRLVSLVDTLHLPGTASLHVVRVAERYCVVGRSSSSLQTLAEIPAAEIEGWDAAYGSNASTIAPVLRFAERIRERR